MEKRKVCVQLLFSEAETLCKIQRKTLVLGSLFHKAKIISLQPATLFKKRLQHRCFAVNFTKFLMLSFLQNNSGRLFQIFWEVCVIMFVYMKMLWLSCSQKKNLKKKRQKKRGFPLKSLFFEEFYIKYQRLVADLNK